CLQYITSPRTF
nr:immunoglobulin light chain junction region [Macaca mulatta]MOW55226.1 immunoglobulin light chain junction region [Macaca mulatta]